MASARLSGCKIKNVNSSFDVPSGTTLAVIRNAKVAWLQAHPEAQESEAKSLFKDVACSRSLTGFGVRAGLWRPLRKKRSFVTHSKQRKRPLNLAKNI
jgi:hypothetical protein